MDLSKLNEETLVEMDPQNPKRRGVPQGEPVPEKDRDDVEFTSKGKKYTLAKPKEELEEEEKPDFPDVDGDGDREEPISKAQKDKKSGESEDKEDDKEESDETFNNLKDFIT